MAGRIRKLFSFAPNRSSWTIVVAALTVLGVASAAQAQIVGFGGSSMTGWTPNTNTAGLPSVAGPGDASDVLTLTNPTGGIATSYWLNTPQNITNFVESFTYTSTGGADGIAVAWQNAGTSALGGGGGSLGYGGITTAAAMGMNIYSGNSGSGSQFNNSTTINTGVATTPTAGMVNIASGNPINVVFSYRQADNALTETMTDTVTNATFTRVWRNVNIQGQVGSTSAFIGLTGATGGVTSTQTVTNFHFTTGVAGPTPVAMITPVAVTGFNQKMIIPSSGVTTGITATIDGGTALTGNTFYTRGANPNSPVAGLPAGGEVFGSATDANHTFSLQSTGNDAVMLDSANTTGSLSLLTPARFSVLSFLVANGNGTGNINLTVHYAGGGTQDATISGLDWFNNSPIAVDANGRATTALVFANTNSGNPRMYQQDVTLTDTIDNVLSIDFTWAGTGGNRSAIFGISGQIVPIPEPSSFALLGLGAIGFVARRRRARRK